MLPLLCLFSHLCSLELCMSESYFLQAICEVRFLSPNIFLWRAHLPSPPPCSHRKEAGPSMQSRRWAAAGPVRKTWKRWRKSWTQAWTPPAAHLAGSPPLPPHLLRRRVSTRTAVRRPRRWPRCLRRARGGGAWRPRWASRHRGPKAPQPASRRQVKQIFRENVFYCKMENKIYIQQSWTNIKSHFFNIK